jgi:hypothetical protein
MVSFKPLDPGQDMSSAYCDIGRLLDVSKISAHAFVKLLAGRVPKSGGPGMVLFHQGGDSVAALLPHPFLGGVSLRVVADYI